MSLTVKETSNYTPPPAGTHCARCFGVVDLGTQVDQKFGARPKVLLIWQLPNERLEYEENGVKKERPQTISKEYGASLGRKADLRKHLDAWRGRPFSDDELKGFHLPNILGAPCLVTIAHVPKLTGGISAKVTAVTACPRGTSVLEVVGKPYSFDIEEGKDSESFRALPEWIQNKVSKCVEWTGDLPPHQDGQAEVEEESEEVPF